MAGSLARKARGRTVRDVMSMQVVSVVPEMTIGELVLTFMEEKVRGAPVLDPVGKILGVVSEEDVMRLTLRHHGANGQRQVDGVHVSEVMRPPAVVAPDDPLRALLHAFVHEGVRRALVVENDILVGIVTPLDALRGLVGEA